MFYKPLKREGVIAIKVPNKINKKLFYQISHSIIGFKVNHKPQNRYLARKHHFYRTSIIKKVILQTINQIKYLKNNKNNKINKNYNLINPTIVKILIFQTGIK